MIDTVELSKAEEIVRGLANVIYGADPQLKAAAQTVLNGLNYFRCLAASRLGEISEISDIKRRGVLIRGTESQ